jgi:alpha-1,2-mannosyltransferase
MLEELILLVFGDKTALWEAFVRTGRGVVSAILLLVSLVFLYFMADLTYLGR